MADANKEVASSSSCLLQKKKKSNDSNKYGGNVSSKYRSNTVVNTVVNVAVHMCSERQLTAAWRPYHRRPVCSSKCRMCLVVNMVVPM